MGNLSHSFDQRGSFNWDNNIHLEKNTLILLIILSWLLQATAKKSKYKIHVFVSQGKGKIPLTYYQKQLENVTGIVLYYQSTKKRKKQSIHSNTIFFQK